MTRQRFTSACLDVGRWKMCDRSRRTRLYKEVHLGQWFQVCAVVLWEVPGSSTNSKNRCSELRVTEALPVKTQLSLNPYMHFSRCFLCLLILSGDRKKNCCFRAVSCLRSQDPGSLPVTTHSSWFFPSSCSNWKSLGVVKVKEIELKVAWSPARVSDPQVILWFYKL